MIRKSIEYCFVSLYERLKYIYFQFWEKYNYGDYKFPYNEVLLNDRVYVLANGPSLKSELEVLLKNDDFIISPKFALNTFSVTDAYEKIKPEYYCIADKLFFIEDTSELFKKTIQIINDITNWNMNLYVPNIYYNKIKEKISNPYIKIHPISTLRYRGFESMKYKYYKEGRGVPIYVNVVIMVEYILLNLGCKDIRLYGVDHTFFDGLTVNDENIPCMVDRHFYGEVFVPIRNGNITISGWLYDKYLTFKEHENMRGYADYLGARIVNCTTGSLIDAYVRLAQLEKEEKQDKV